MSLIEYLVLPLSSLLMHKLLSARTLAETLPHLRQLGT